MKPELVYIAQKDIGILYPPKQTLYGSAVVSLTKACMASLREDKDDLASFKYEKEGISFKVPVLGSPLSSSIHARRGHQGNKYCSQGLLSPIAQDKIIHGRPKRPSVQWPIQTCRPTSINNCAVNLQKVSHFCTEQGFGVRMRSTIHPASRNLKM